jgi:hypothetical protein
MVCLDVKRFSAVSVSLPREWFQENKRMVWFIFNLHPRVSFVFIQRTVDQYLHNVHTCSFIEPLAKIIRTPTCSLGQIPIHSGPLSSNNCPTLWLLPLSPFTHPSAYITLFTMTTSTITGFFVRDS